MYNSSQPSFRLTPFSTPLGSEVDFGAEITGIDLSELSDSDFLALEKAVYTYQVVVVRDQGSLSPKAQLGLNRRFDPDTESYGHGHDAKLMEKSVLVQDLVSIPDAPQVKLLGNGFVEKHEGLENIKLTHPSHKTFHKDVLNAEQEKNNFTRFYRWHIDAALYQLEPPKVTTLLALSVPEPRTQTVLYDDGSGDSLEVSLGTTVFVSGYKAYRDLTSEQKDFVQRAVVKYAPHPYIWMKTARALSNGLGLVSEGKELDHASLPPIDDNAIKIFPMLWMNPVTNEPALQIHPCCVEDILVDGVSIGNLETCRHKLYELMRPAIAPSKIYAHPWKAGDLVIFHNRGVWHSVVGALREDDVRIYHQCNLASNEPPVGFRPKYFY